MREPPQEPAGASPVPPLLPLRAALAQSCEYSVGAAGAERGVVLRHEPEGWTRYLLSPEKELFRAGRPRNLDHRPFVCLGPCTWETHLTFPDPKTCPPPHLQERWDVSTVSDVKLANGRALLTAGQCSMSTPFKTLQHMNKNTVINTMRGRRY